MATQWYWKDGESAKGPISFQEMVSMVHDRVLNEDDFVRPHYSKDWQSTDTVVGLFYMAQRVPVPKQEVTPVDTKLGESFGMHNSLQNTNTVRTYRLDEVAHEFVSANSLDLGTNQGSNEGTDDQFLESAEAPSDSEVATKGQSENEMVSAISAAAEEWDRRHVSIDNINNQSSEVHHSTGFVAWILGLPWRWTISLRSLIGRALDGFIGIVVTVIGFANRSFGFRRVCRIIAQVISRQTLSRCFRFGCALIVAGLVSFVITSWSKYEELRFPDAEKLASGRTMFPLYGTCSSLEYTFVLTEVTLAAAVMGYFGAAALESLAED